METIGPFLRQHPPSLDNADSLAFSRKLPGVAVRRVSACTVANAIWCEAGCARQQRFADPSHRPSPKAQPGQSHLGPAGLHSNRKTPKNQIRWVYSVLLIAPSCPDGRTPIATIPPKRGQTPLAALGRANPRHPPSGRENAAKPPWPCPAKSTSKKTKKLPDSQKNLAVVPAVPLRLRGAIAWALA